MPENRLSYFELKAITSGEKLDNQHFIDTSKPYTKKEIKFIAAVRLKYGDMIVVKNIAEILKCPINTIYSITDMLPKRQVIKGNRMLLYIECIVIIMRKKRIKMTITELNKNKGTSKNIIVDPDIVKEDVK